MPAPASVGAGFAPPRRERWSLICAICGLLVVVTPRLTRVLAARRPAAALLLGAALAACQEGRPPVAPPHLVLVEAAHDVGQVPQGTPIEHAFEISNTGGAPLTLIDLRAGCDCAVTLEGPQDLPPGGHAALRLRCDTSGVAGPLRRTLTVYSNDPEQRAALLTVTGTVALEAVAEPRRVYLGPQPPGRDAVRRVALRAGNDGVRFLSVSGGAPQLRTRLEDGADGRELVISIDAGAPPGPFQTAVRIHTTSAARPLIEVPVAGIVTAEAGAAS